MKKSSTCHTSVSKSRHHTSKYSFKYIYVLIKKIYNIIVKNERNNSDLFNCELFMNIMCLLFHVIFLFLYSVTTVITRLFLLTFTQTTLSMVFIRQEGFFSPTLYSFYHHNDVRIFFKSRKKNPIRCSLSWRPPPPVSDSSPSRRWSRPILIVFYRR